MADTCSPKETVIALQEYVERLTNRLTYLEESEGSDVEESNDTQTSTTAQQVIRLIGLYAKGTATLTNPQ